MTGFKITEMTDNLTGEVITLNGDWEAFDETVASVDAWYDRHTRLWIIQLRNKDGYQVGDAVIVYGKADAMKRTAELKAEYGL